MQARRAVKPDARVRWRCRRGMREMDLLLERFLDEGYPHLNAAERQAFEELLACPDQDVYAWVLGSTPAPNERLGRLASIIRACTVARG